MAPKKLENVHVIYNRHAALPTLFEDREIIEMAVEGAEGIGSSYDGSVNGWVIIRVGRHDTGSRAGENNF